MFFQINLFKTRFFFNNKAMSFMPFFIASFLLLVSCVSTYTSLQELHPGSSKERVRNTVGKPFSVGRSDGIDHWTYKFKWNSQEYTRNVFFDEGKVQKVGPLTPYPNYRQKMIEAESLEEYEINAALYQKQKQDGFREINSLNKQNNTPRFCSSRFSDTHIPNCKNIIKNTKFMPQAIKFCDNKTSQTKQLRCLKIISNKKFSHPALNFCNNKISHIQQLRCLKIISNKKFSHPALNFCNKNAPLSDIKLKCLNNLGNSQI